MRTTNNSAQSVLDTSSTQSSSSSQSLHQANFFNIQISSFLGDPELLEFFISQVKDVSASNRWTDKQTLTFAKSKLDGPARTFIVQTLEYKPIATSAELFNILRAQFKKENLCKAIAEFNSMTMLPTESISNLAHRLDALTPRAHNTIKETDALSAIKFNKFISIIPSNYRVHILQNNIKTYAEAVEKAKLLQDCEVNNELICQTSLTTPLQDIKTQINKLQETITHLSQKPSNEDNPSQKKVAKNKNLNVQTVRENRNFRNFRNTQNFRGRFNRSRSFQRRPNHNSQRSYNNHTKETFSNICQFCGLHGHTCRFCPSFKNFFIPRNSTASQDQQFLALPTPQSTPAPCSSTSTAYNEPIVSDLNVDAPSFSMPHPNW